MNPINHPRYADNLIGFVLIALTLGALVGFFVLRWWTTVVVIVFPLPFYAGIALDVYGNGFGDNWQYGIPLWVVPACVGLLIGAIAKRATRHVASGRH